MFKVDSTVCLKLEKPKWVEKKKFRIKISNRYTPFIVLI